MTIVIVCVLVAIILLILLVRMNSRALSSDSKTSQVLEEPLSGQITEEPQSEQASAGAENDPAALSEDQNKKQTNASIKDTDLKMKDDGYRQALQKFKSQPASDPKKAQKDKMVIKDDEFRKALNAMKSKHPKK
ncbi:hypothetical protein [Peribacillus deserti]|uniref:Uncharacterized protein n=1 Tax=Peribacillus deserti TaxID=673318 RepID=A0A2N5M3R2_9BACI|nr:hypothetical protein [Peribacillus deserti]PLT28998.1 hypothetical protein CUU66_15190 [Peribacillus deserti]